MSQVVDVAGRIPVRKGDWSESDGRVTISRPKFGRIGTAFAKFLRLPQEVRITLDALGTAAWTRMDGRTVSEILHELEALYPDEGRLDERLGQYLANLARAGLLRFEDASSRD